jgi:aldehyde:ferredoxin oxidoreductase
MASPGFTGKILKVDLTKGKIESIDSSKYEEFGGGYGTAIALFWDLCVAPGGWDLQDAFDPRNIVSIMSGPLTGAGIPFAGRTSVSGLSPQGWPINWFTKSNFGGDFVAMLKFAGWDGVVVQGKSPKPVYINIIDDKVTIEDAQKLWGLDTWETQIEIVKQQTGYNASKGDLDWRAVGKDYTLRKPAIVTTSQAGEKLSRIASLQHGGGAAAGLGGFGGVFGSKKLKAIAVVGTGGIKVADPKVLLATREWLTGGASGGMGGGFGGAQQAKNSCIGCTRACRARAATGGGRDSDGCMETTWYTVHPPSKKTAPADAQRATDLPQKYGLNSFDTCFGGVMWFDAPTAELKPATPEAPGSGWYIKRLYDAGIIGPGKKVDTAPLPMDKYETYEFAEIYAKTVANRVGIGDLLAEGVVRFAEKIGRIDDLNTILRCPSWGYTDHWAMPEVSWAYGDLVDSRDICNHDLQMPLMSVGGGMGGGMMGGRGGGGGQDAGAWAQTIVKAMVPYHDDPFMLDYSWKTEQAYKTGIYSEHKAKLVAWRMHYQTFFKESCLFCDWGYASYQNRGGKGTPDAEPRIYNAVTGKNMSFADGIEIGRKAWTLRRAILAMQGRHKKNEKFAGYMYRPGASASGFTNTLPIYDGTSWKFTDCKDLYFDDKGVETWKTHYYKLEGWDPETGYPTQATLESLGLKRVADILKKNKKLGSA